MNAAEFIAKWRLTQKPLRLLCNYEKVLASHAIPLPYDHDQNRSPAKYRHYWDIKKR